MHTLQESQILVGLFSEPMRVEIAKQGGDGSWTVALVGTQTERFRRVTLTPDDFAGLTVHDAGFRYDGDGQLLRLGLQAYSLGIAWEFDPYFGPSISRVDPLPHQLEAVYDHLLNLARALFLLADERTTSRTASTGVGRTYHPAPSWTASHTHLGVASTPGLIRSKHHADSSIAH